MSIIAMGCSKNLVDAERVAFMLREAGYTPEFDPARPRGIVVINTCGFIGDAKEESINAILETAELKKRGRVSKIIVMGCLSERYRAELPANSPRSTAGTENSTGLRSSTTLKPTRQKTMPRLP